MDMSNENNLLARVGQGLLAVAVAVAGGTFLALQIAMLAG
jgi:hypothetical protein